MEMIQPVRPELLAAKMEKIQNFELPELLEEFDKEPHLVRLLWHLQFVSRSENYPGGLGRFARDFIEARSHQVGTAWMAKSTSKNGSYVLQDALQILNELSDGARCELFGDDTWAIENEYVRRRHEDWSDDQGGRNKNSGGRECKALLLDRLTERSLKAVCLEKARQELGGYFKRLCEEPHVGLRPSLSPSYLEPRHEGAPWYFAGVADALLSFIAERERATKTRIADTEITQLVSKWIRKSRNTRCAVMIIGNSRFGKTEAVKMNAEIAPGACRVVETPDSTAIGDLLRAVARCLGLQLSAHNQVRDLREQIEYVLRYSGLQLIFDESQFLLPGSFSRNTSPARLNWVRRSMMDRGVPVVFVCTPQSYLPAKRRFVNATGFAMEQFDERVLVANLPTELCESDLLSVARIHFPNQRKEYLRYIVDQLIATERNFVSDIEKIALLAQDSAHEAGRKTVILADIDGAMADVLPTKKGASVEPLPGPAKHARCNGSAKPVRKPRRAPKPLPIPNREPRPLIPA